MDKLIRKKFKHIKSVKNLHKKLSQEYGILLYNIKA